MEATVTKKDVLNYRRHTWVGRHGKGLRTLGQAADFVDEVGMCLLFACEEIPLPKMYSMAADEANWWSWKDLLQQEKRAYNGRLVRRKATLVSMKLLPSFFALYLTGGGHAMYEEEYYWGKLGWLANEAAKYLDRQGPTPVDALRQALVAPGKENTRRFHAALFELQSKFKIVTVGLEDRSWGVRKLDLFMNWLPKRIERAAENMTREEALQRVAGSFVETAGAVTEKTLPKMFGWSDMETTAAIDSLVSGGKLHRVHIRGKESAPWIASRKLLFS
ncbi:MAG: winged helix DNA-binding domain-containing protein, partial [Candidatus Lindowbacteria bacterium]|nr:winged helix DNA-binding domain-containing protein [Candidatus Lindowbacteria bacterium]